MSWSPPRQRNTVSQLLFLLVCWLSGVEEPQGSRTPAGRINLPGKQHRSTREKAWNNSDLFPYHDSCYHVLQIMKCQIAQNWSFSLKPAVLWQPVTWTANTHTAIQEYQRMYLPPNQVVTVLASAFRRSACSCLACSSLQLCVPWSCFNYRHFMVILTLTGRERAENARSY